MNHNTPTSCHCSKRRNKWTSWAETTNPTAALHSFTSSPLTLEQSHLTRPLFRKWKRKLHISPSILTATRLLLFTWGVREIEDTGIIHSKKQPESRNRPVLTSQVLLERSGTFDSAFGQRMLLGYCTITAGGRVYKTRTNAGIKMFYMAQRIVLILIW